jgi:hypothetical protein
MASTGMVEYARLAREITTTHFGDPWLNSSTTAGLMFKALSNVSHRQAA